MLQCGNPFGIQTVTMRTLHDYQVVIAYLSEIRLGGIKSRSTSVLRADNHYCSSHWPRNPRSTKRGSNFESLHHYRSSLLATDIIVKSWGALREPVRQSCHHHQKRYACPRRWLGRPNKRIRQILSKFGQSQRYKNTAKLINLSNFNGLLPVLNCSITQSENFSAY